MEGGREGVTTTETPRKGECEIPTLSLPPSLPHAYPCWPSESLQQLLFLVPLLLPRPSLASRKAFRPEQRVLLLLLLLLRPPPVGEEGGERKGGKEGGKEGGVRGGENIQSFAFP